MEIGAIIEALGGPTRIAEALGRVGRVPYCANSVVHWRSRGRIPAHLMAPLVRVAKKVAAEAATKRERARAARVTFETLSRHTGPRKPRAGADVLRPRKHQANLLHRPGPGCGRKADERTVLPCPCANESLRRDALR